jgi:hypothetical protein
LEVGNGEICGPALQRYRVLVGDSFQVTYTRHSALRPDPREQLQTQSFWDYFDGH